MVPMVIAVTRHVGTAAELHALPMPTDGTAVQMWHMAPTGRAVVMGSAQKPEQFRHERLVTDQVELGGRRSGGGAVYIDPLGVAWVDVLVPASSALYSRDLVEMFERVGRLWHDALGRCGIEAAMFEAGAAAPSSRSESARLACWAGIGWGELVLGSAKIIGLSQRRTRWGARVQGMAVLNASAGLVVDYLDVDDAVADQLRAAIGPAVELSVSSDDVIAALTEVVGAAI